MDFSHLVYALNVLFNSSISVLEGRISYGSSATELLYPVGVYGYIPINSNFKAYVPIPPETCVSDLDTDFDVDGLDLAMQAADFGLVYPPQFAYDFGNHDCSD